MSDRTRPTRPSIADLVAATPPSRERYVDFLRAASIVVVMVGHWTMAVVVRRDGEWFTTNLLAEVRWMWVATWLLQVMPVFFFVGGFSNLVTLDAAERRGETYADFAASRAWRLMKPVVILLGIWLPLVTIAQAAALAPEDMLRTATGVVSQPLWFIGIYLIVTALAPPMRLLHRRFGWRVPVGLAAGTGVIDVLRFTVGAGPAAFLNFGLVWLFAHQLGFFYADGSLRRLNREWLFAGVAVGLGALWLLTTFGPYPRSMVGLPGETISNMNPPSICLVALTTWQAALVLLLRDPASRWLQRPRPWGLVVAANASIMTTFLWHLTALLIVAAVAIPAGFPQPSVGSMAWWLLRIPWIALLATVTLIFVLLFGPWERPGSRGSPGAGATLPAALAMSAIIVGVCGFAVSGLVDLVAPNGRRLIVLPVSPLMNLGALILGAALFYLARLRVRGTAGAGGA